MKDKHTIRVSDAIPEMPASFERTAERTLASVCTATSTQSARGTVQRAWSAPQSGKRRNPHSIALRIGLASVAGMLVICVLAIGGVVIANAVRDRTQTTAPLSQPTAPIFVPTYSAEVHLLPELKDAEVYAEARARALQPAFSEEDWGWLRKIESSIEDFMVTRESVLWTTAFRIPKDAEKGITQNPFASYDKTDTMEFVCDTALVRIGGDAQTLIASPWSEQDFSFDETVDAWTVRITTTYRRPDLTAGGTAEIVQTFRMLDNLVDTQANIATVGMIEQHLTFDASNVPQGIPAVCIDRPLSGEVTLTVTENGRMRNVPVNLDGVVLTETAHWYDDGVNLSYTVKSAPQGWTDAYTEALFRFGTPQTVGLHLMATIGSGHTDATNAENTARGQITFALRLDEAHRNEAKQHGCTVALLLNCIHAFNEQPVGSDFTMPEGADDYTIGVREQALGSFELAIPETRSDTFELQPTPKPDDSTQPYREQIADVVPAVFVSGGETTEPYALMISEQTGGSIRDCLGFDMLLKRDRVDAAQEVPVVRYADDFKIDVQNDGTLSTVYLLNLNGERIVSDVDPATDLKSLASGAYYLVAEIDVRTDNSLTTYQCVCRLDIP